MHILSFSGFISSDYWRSAFYELIFELAWEYSRGDEYVSQWNQSCEIHFIPFYSCSHSHVYYLEQLRVRFTSLMGWGGEGVTSPDTDTWREMWGLICIHQFQEHPFPLFLFRKNPFFGEEHCFLSLWKLTLFYGNDGTLFYHQWFDQVKVHPSLISTEFFYYTHPFLVIPRTCRVPKDDPFFVKSINAAAYPFYPQLAVLAYIILHHFSAYLWSCGTYRGLASMPGFFDVLSPTIRCVFVNDVPVVNQCQEHFFPLFLFPTGPSFYHNLRGNIGTFEHWNINACDVNSLVFTRYSEEQPLDLFVHRHLSSVAGGR